MRAVFVRLDTNAKGGIYRVRGGDLVCPHPRIRAFVSTVPENPSMKRFLTTAVLLAATLTATIGFAQEKVTSPEGVSVTRAGEWEDATCNDRGTFTFHEPETKSQIEVISTALLTPDVKDVFFSTFHEGLTAAGFTQENTSEETFGDRTGELTEYSFEHSGAKLVVSVFQFMMGNNAWLVVSYAGEDAADTVRKSFEEVVGSLKIQDGD